MQYESILSSASSSCSRPLCISSSRFSKSLKAVVFFASSTAASAVSSTTRPRDDGPVIKPPHISTAEIADLRDPALISPTSDLSGSAADFVPRSSSFDAESPYRGLNGAIMYQAQYTYEATASGRFAKQKLIAPAPDAMAEVVHRIASVLSFNPAGAQEFQLSYFQTGSRGVSGDSPFSIRLVQDDSDHDATILITAVSNSKLDSKSATSAPTHHMFSPMAFKELIETSITNKMKKPNGGEQPFSLDRLSARSYSASGGHRTFAITNSLWLVWDEANQLLIRARGHFFGEHGKGDECIGIKFTIQATSNGDGAGAGVTEEFDVTIVNSSRIETSKFGEYILIQNRFLHLPKKKLSELLFT